MSICHRVKANICDAAWENPAKDAASHSEQEPFPRHSEESYQFLDFDLIQTIDIILICQKLAHCFVLSYKMNRKVLVS